MKGQLGRSLLLVKEGSQNGSSLQFPKAASPSVPEYVNAGIGAAPSRMLPRGLASRVA